MGPRRARSGREGPLSAPAVAPVLLDRSRPRGGNIDLCQGDTLPDLRHAPDTLSKPSIGPCFRKGWQDTHVHVQTELQLHS